MSEEHKHSTTKSEAVALHPVCSALHDTEHRDCIMCPHCGHEMDDSEAWGYTDVEWDEPGQCPKCEGHFQWSRFISVTYTTTPSVGSTDSSPNDGTERTDTAGGAS